MFFKIDFDLLIIIFLLLSIIIVTLLYFLSKHELDTTRRELRKQKVSAMKSTDKKNILGLFFKSKDKKINQYAKIERENKENSLDEINIDEKIIGVQEPVGPYTENYLASKLPFLRELMAINKEGGTRWVNYIKAQEKIFGKDIARKGR